MQRLGQIEQNAAGVNREIETDSQIKVGGGPQAQQRGAHTDVRPVFQHDKEAAAGQGAADGQAGRVEKQIGPGGAGEERLAGGILEPDQDYSRGEQCPGQQHQAADLGISRHDYPVRGGIQRRERRAAQAEGKSN